MTGLLDQFHALADRRVCGNAIKKEKLKGSEPEGRKNFQIKLRTWPRKKGFDLLVQQHLPAQCAEHQSSGQIAVSGRKRIDRIAAQQIVSVRLVPLNC